MTKRDDKADSPLRQTKLTNEQQKALTVPLARLEDELYRLLAGYRLYDYAVANLTQPEDADNSEAEHFAFGVFLYQRQLQQQGDNLMETLLSIKQMVGDG